MSAKPLSLSEHVDQLEILKKKGTLSEAEFKQAVQHAIAQSRYAIGHAPAEENKTQLVVITGASSGIGAATAKLFSGLGHPLLLLARRVERMEELKLPNTLCAKCDVTKQSDLEAALKLANEHFGAEVHPFVVVNNAGVMLLGQFSTQEGHLMERMLDVNVKGILNVTRVFLNGMLERKTGYFVNISSIAGQKTFPDHAVYCGTKFAVRALTESLRGEYCAKGVKFVSICPGVVNTELLGHTPDASFVKGYEEWKKTMTTGCLEAIDIANTVVFAVKQPERSLVREITISPGMQPA